MIDTKEVTKAALRDAAKLSVDQDVQIPRPKRREWGAATLLLLLSLAGLFAGRLGFLWPTFDVFSQLTAQFMCTAIAFAIAIYFAKRMTTTIGFVITFLLLAFYGVGGFQFSPLKVEANGSVNSFRFMSFNIFKFNTRSAELAASILKENADVLVLVEVTVKNQPVVAELRKHYPFSATCPPNFYCQQLVLSKYPIRDSNVHNSPYQISVSVDLPTGPTTVVGFHNTRFPRSALQLKNTINFLREIEHLRHPIIVAGDFNATPFSRILQMFEQQSGLERLTSLPTWPSTLGIPQLSIDHVFVSDEFEVEEGPTLGSPSGSDHYPILVTLRHTPKGN